MWRTAVLYVTRYVIIQCVSKKRANFETVYLEIIRIDFDDIWLKFSKDSRIEFACFSFRVGLPIFSNFSSL